MCKIVHSYPTPTIKGESIYEFISNYRKIGNVSATLTFLGEGVYKNTKTNCANLEYNISFPKFLQSRFHRGK